MMSMVRQRLGFILAFIGFLGIIIACVTPKWKVMTFTKANNVTAQVIWEGLWMNCVMQSTGQMQCKSYDSLLALPQDLQAARALVVIAIIVSLMGVLLSIAGNKYTNFVKNLLSRAKVTNAAKCFTIASVLVLVSVCWSCIAIIRDFYNPIQAGQETKVGAALSISLGASLLLMKGGRKLSANSPPKNIQS